MRPVRLKVERRSYAARTCLGMALTREIIEAHGGHIALANREGGGLCVSLSLPD